MLHIYFAYNFCISTIQIVYISRIYETRTRSYNYVCDPTIRTLLESGNVCIIVSYSPAGLQNIIENNTEWGKHTEIEEIQIRNTVHIEVLEAISEDCIPIYYVESEIDTKVYFDEYERFQIQHYPTPIHVELTEKEDDFISYNGSWVQSNVIQISVVTVDIWNNTKLFVDGELLISDGDIIGFSDSTKAKLQSI